MSLRRVLIIACLLALALHHALVLRDTTSVMAMVTCAGFLLFLEIMERVRL